MKQCLLVFSFLISFCLNAHSQTSYTKTNILTFQTWDVQHAMSTGLDQVTAGWAWSCANCGSTTSGTVQQTWISSDRTVIFVYLLDNDGNMVISEPGGVYTYTGTPVPTTAPTLCCGGSAVSFNANQTNTINVQTFVNRTANDSQVYIEQLGTQNKVVVEQTGTKQNYVNYYGNGLSNDVDIKQSGNASTQVNYTDLRVVGNFNTVKIEQTSTGGGKGAFVNVQNNNNSLTLKQQDNGSHYAEVNLSGGSKTVDILQQGSAGHMASVTLTGPQPASLNLIQAGTTQQYYSITNNCATAGGCAPISVTQGR